MICIGDKKLSCCCLGDEKIKKVYRGEDLLYKESGFAVSAAAVPAEAGEVLGTGLYAEGTGAELTAVPNGQYKFVKWLSEEAPQRLPEGYTELEYIQTDNACGFDTGVIIKSTHSFELDLECGDFVSGTEYMFYSLSTPYLRLYRYSATVVRALLYSSTVSSLTADIANKRIAIHYKNSVISLLGTWFSNSNTLNTTGNFFLFSPLSSSKSTAAKLYSAKIYNGEDVVRDFVPCIDPSGCVGLYDLAEGKFYANSWSGTVTAGPASRTAAVTETVSFVPTKDTALTAVFERILPEGYELLEYIESPGLAGNNVDTGIYSRSYSRVLAEMEILDGNFSSSTTSKALIYSSATSVSGSIYYYTGVRAVITSAGKIAISTWSNSTSGKSYTFDCVLSPSRTTIEIDMPNKTAAVNDVVQTITYTASNFSATNAKYYLFGFGTTNMSKCRLYSLKHYVYGTQISHFVPCTNPDGIHGLYKLQSGDFLTSSTSGLLIAGPTL